MAKSKTAKKQWCAILAPKMFRGVPLGETLVFEQEDMIGKKINQNLMTLTNDAKRQNIKINFEITSVKDGKALTDIIGYEMVKASVKRFARKNIDKIDLSFVCITSDKKAIRIKPIIITRSPISSAVGTKIRKNAEIFLKKYVGNITYDNFTNDLINHKMQSILKSNLNKVHPLRVCEIRAMHITKMPKSMSQEEAPKEEKPVENKETKPAEEKEAKPIENKPAEKVEAKETAKAA